MQMETRRGGERLGGGVWAESCHLPVVSQVCSWSPTQTQGPSVLLPDPPLSSAWDVRAQMSLCPLTQCGPAGGGQRQGGVLASAGEDAAVGQLGGCVAPSDFAEGSRARSLGPFPLQLGSWKPPRPGTDQSHSPGGGEHFTGGLPLGGIWGQVGSDGVGPGHTVHAPAPLGPEVSW